MDRSDDNISSLWKKQQKTLPLWAQRLGRSSSPPQSLKWPPTPEEGLWQSVQLSDFGHRQLIASTRLQYPEASTESIAVLAYDTLSSWEQIRSSLRLQPRTPSRGHY